MRARPCVRCVCPPACRPDWMTQSARARARFQRRPTDGARTLKQSTIVHTHTHTALVRNGIEMCVTSARRVRDPIAAASLRRRRRRRCRSRARTAFSARDPIPVCVCVCARMPARTYSNRNRSGTHIINETSAQSTTHKKKPRARKHIHTYYNRDIGLASVGVYAPIKRARAQITGEFHNYARTLARSLAEISKHKFLNTCAALESHWLCVRARNWPLLRTTMCRQITQPMRITHYIFKHIRASARARVYT